ncbi:hypothetical protein Pfo_000596, partial [Paulownia fortunei]
ELNNREEHPLTPELGYPFDCGSSEPIGGANVALNQQVYRSPDVIIRDMNDKRAAQNINPVLASIEQWNSIDTSVGAFDDKQIQTSLHRASSIDNVQQIVEISLIQSKRAEISPRQLHSTKSLVLTRNQSKCLLKSSTDSSGVN